MNIMQIVSGTAVNGASVACLEITRGLADRGHRVTLVCRPEAWIADQLGSQNVDIVFSELHRWPPVELRRIGKLARDKQIAVLQTHMSRANFFGVLLRYLYGIPSVAMAHNRHVQPHWMFNDHVVAPSEATRRFHRRFNLVRASRIDVIHNFVDDSPYHHADAQTRERLRAELGIERNALIVGVVGDVIPRKGFLNLVRALPTIGAAAPSVHVLSIGYQQEEYTARVIAEAKRLGVAERLTLAGARTDVPQLLAAMDVFVLPSLEDTLPCAILEAMATGLPVVSTMVGGIPECVLDGQTGCLVPPGDSARLADALIRLLGDAQLRQSWGQAGRERVRQCFSRDSQIARWEELLRRVAA
jgi:glycosyltransferase involved in cell wall biosynthesis